MKKILILMISIFALVGAPSIAANHVVDTAHTYVWFTINHLGIGNSLGQFREVKGNFDLEGGVLNMSIKADSLDTNDGKRDDHLKGPDFFNVVQFPELSFTASKVVAKGDNKFDVTGEMTLHGKKKEITVEVTRTGQGKDPWGNERTGIEAKFTIKRSDFGMNYMAELLGDDVEIYFSSEGIKK